jgi:diguanylate cyclase (GGDEF)-like protein/PAS domain S-box-containing protein
VHIRPLTFVAIWLLLTVSLLAAQSLSLASAGRLEVVGVLAVWTAAAAVALAGTLAAALRLPRGAVRTAWLLWSVGSGAWLAGVLARDVAALTGIDLPPGLAEALGWLFAVFCLAGLRVRAPSESFSLRLFALDALPVGLLTIALVWTVLGDLVNEPTVILVGSGAYLVAYIVLALMSFQLMAIDGFGRVPTNMWILGPGFSLTAAAAVLWPGHAPPSAAAAAASTLLSTAGLLLVGAAGFRRAFSPGSFSRLSRPHRESGVRAVPPAVAVVGLVTLLFFALQRDVNVLGAFLLAAVFSVGFRFYLARRDLVWSQEALSQSEERYRELFENAGDCVFILDSRGTFTSANLATELTLGYASEELLGRKLSDFVAPGSGETVPLALDGGGTDERQALACELDVVVKHGRHVQLDLSARAITQQGEPLGWQCIGRDMTERRRFVEQLRHRAFHDSLTGLANRDLFADRVEHALAHRSGGTSSTAVLLLDLDDFKAVNDSLGHQAGDLLLVAVAARLRSCARPSDTCARLGGDEFAILLENASAEAAVAVADRILDALRPAVRIGGREVFAGVSIGVALGDGGGESSDVLLREADVAMYKAKALGGGRCELARGHDGGTRDGAKDGLTVSALAAGSRRDVASLL